MAVSRAHAGKRHPNQSDKTLSLERHFDFGE
jgi:hypothetical protein